MQLTEEEFENKTLQLADDFFPVGEAPSHGDITALARMLYHLLAAHIAGAQGPVAIPDGWMLVKRERIEEIRQYARTEFVNSYLGRNLYDECSLMKNERIGEEALSNIRDVLSWIEEDENDRISAQPQPMKDAARDALTKALARYDALIGSIQGCTDGGCLIRKPKGMHTNGGCRCDRGVKAQRAMHAANELRNALAQIERIEREGDK